jgi:mannose-6-phosphate isomerase-like protein (cupin superfamily)
VVHVWHGSGPGYMHIHHEDDECWHVLDGSLTFRLPEGEVVAPAGTTVFVPAGTPHDHFETDGPCRYLIVLTPRLEALIKELHRTPYAHHGEVMKKYRSEIVS